MIKIILSIISHNALFSGLEKTPFGIL